MPHLKVGRAKTQFFFDDKAKSQPAKKPHAKLHKRNKTWR